MTEKVYDFPTEVLDLPSQGKVYPLDNPLSSGQIRIKLMTAKEEDILSSSNLIKKGLAIDTLFESILVDNIKADDIVIGDKNAILLATRLLGYGPDYKFQFYSATIGDLVETTVDLSKVQTKEIDFLIFKNKNEFEYTTPSGTKLTFKILTHGDEKMIDKDIAALQKINKDVSSDISTRLRYMIKSVDGKNDLATINKFVNNMLAKDSRALRDYAKSIAPDMNMKFDYQHEDGDVEEASITMSVGFFWPSFKS
jgi:hypothetical protein